MNFLDLPKDVQATIVSFLDKDTLLNFEQAFDGSKDLVNKYFIWKKKALFYSDQCDLLRKKYAYHAFEHFQDHINSINNQYIKCGCPSCTDLSGNYPQNAENYNGHSKDGIWLLKSNYGEMNKVDYKDCLLYSWFDGLCVEYNCPELIFKTDHPQFHTASTFHMCLGIEKQTRYMHNNRSWFHRIDKLTFDQQKKTLYKLLYHLMYYDEITSNVDERDYETFDQWFEDYQV